MLTNNHYTANNLMLTIQNSIRSPCKHIATFSVCVHSEVFLTRQRHPFFTPLTHHTPTFDLRSVFSPNLSHHFCKSILPFLSHNGYTSVFWYPYYFVALFYTFPPRYCLNSATHTTKLLQNSPFFERQIRNKYCSKYTLYAIYKYLMYSKINIYNYRNT